jgi:glycosyltransferase involved in cell wall biosynthesis
MKLSILIPTYRRPRNVEQTVISILTLFEAAPFAWEIVISNNLLVNKNEPARLAIEANPKIRIISPDQHLLSAEENFQFGLGYCTGELIWLLGDDDVLVPAGIEQLIIEIKDGNFDLLIAGCKMISYDGQLVAATRQPSHELNQNITLLDYVKRTGFWFVLAGFSTTIFRRSYFDVSLFKETMAISKIYSHATTLVGSFYNKNFKFRNYSIVEYRQNRTDVIDSGHWKQAAKSQGVTVKHFWVKGFIGHLELLINRGVFDHQFLGEVIDLVVGKRFRFLDHLIGHLLEQVQMGFKQSSQQLSVNELADIIQFLERIAPEYYDLWITLRSLNGEQDKAAIKKLIHQFNWWWGRQGNSIHHFLDLYQFAVCGKYNISRYDGHYYAYDSTNNSKLAEVLMYIDFREVKPYLLSAKTLEELNKKVIDLERELEELTFNQKNIRSEAQGPSEAFSTHLLNRQEHFFKSTSWELFGPIRVIKRYFLEIVGRIAQWVGF